MTPDHGPTRPSQDSDDGFTLVELALTMVVTAMLLVLIPSVIKAASDASAYSQGTSIGTAQAATAVQEIQARIQSASQICLPTQMTTVGPTVTSGFGVRVLSSAFGKSLWDQWIVNTSTGVLQEQKWPTTWTAGNAVPAWITLAKRMTNSTTVPFALPTVVTGSPQTLSIDLQSQQSYGNRSQPVEFKTTIAAFDTPYSSNPTVTCASAATQEGWT